MGQRPHLASLEYYHIYNRGTERRRVFLSNGDYDRFTALLYLSNGTKTVHISNHQGSTLMDLLSLDRGESLVDIGAYCLMPNHFHLLLRQREEDGISRFMQKLVTGYTMYFNKKNERSGALFQGKFKSVHAHDDRYLKYVISYIHLNPARLLGEKSSLRAADFVRYPYSSYLDHLGHERVQNKIIDKQCLPDYFSNTEALEQEMQEWLTYEP